MTAISSHIAEGNLRIKYRLTSPINGERLGDFDSVTDIPNPMKDEKTGVVMRIRLENLRPVYLAPEQ